MLDGQNDHVLPMNHPNRRKVLECGGNPESFRGTPLLGEAMVFRTGIDAWKLPSQSGVTATALQDASAEFQCIKC